MYFSIFKFFYLFVFAFINANLQPPSPLRWEINKKQGRDHPKCYVYLYFSISQLFSKGTGDFEWCRQTMDELSVFGTSRTSNELKSGP